MERWWPGSRPKHKLGLAGRKSQKPIPFLGFSLNDRFLGNRHTFRLAPWRASVHIDRSHSPRLTQVTFKRHFGALKTQSLVLLRLTSSSTRQTSQKKFNRRPVTPT